MNLETFILTLGVIGLMLLIAFLVDYFEPSDEERPRRMFSDKLDPSDMVGIGVGFFVILPLPLFYLFRYLFGLFS
jgi:hypothetical protein